MCARSSVCPCSIIPLLSRPLWKWCASLEWTSMNLQFMRPRPLNDFNSKVLTKLFTEFGLEFHRLLDCGIYAYMWKGNPLASRESVTMDDLQPYPCLAFEQGNNNSFYFAEEVLSTYEYKQLIRANDRATMLNLMKGLNGYTLCSGIICEELNGGDYCAVPLESDEVMTIGYLCRKGVAISPLGQKYLDEIRKYKNEDARYR